MLFDLYEARGTLDATVFLNVFCALGPKYGNLLGLSKYFFMFRGVYFQKCITGKRLGSHCSYIETTITQRVSN